MTTLQTAIALLAVAWVMWAASMYLLSVLGQRESRRPGRASSHSYRCVVCQTRVTGDALPPSHWMCEGCARQWEES
jgi:hypothetical protein